MGKRLEAKLHLLSVREVQTAGQGDHSDGGGLLLRIRGASVTWVFRYTAATGRRREMGLGPARRTNAAEVGESLTSARKLARDARDLLQAGQDPIDERDRRRDAIREADAVARASKKRQSLTLARAARDYHERAIEPRLSAKHAAQWLSSLENHIPPALWHKPIAQIEAQELLTALSGIRSKEAKDKRVPETLSRIRQRLDVVFEDAIFHKHCTINPAAAIRRKMREQLPTKEAGSFRALDYRAAPGFMVRLRQAEGVSARCLEFAMLTASRTGEVLGAEWAEFDLEANTWAIPGERMKASEPHTVYLSTRAREIVKSQIGLSERLLFPSLWKQKSPMSDNHLTRAEPLNGFPGGEAPSQPAHILGGVPDDLVDNSHAAESLLVSALSFALCLQAVLDQHHHHGADDRADGTPRLDPTGASAIREVEQPEAWHVSEVHQASLKDSSALLFKPTLRTRLCVLHRLCLGREIFQRGTLARDGFCALVVVNSELRTEASVRHRHGVAVHFVSTHLEHMFCRPVHSL